MSEHPVTAVEAARTVAKGAREKTRWNYDTLDCHTLYAVAAAFDAFADALANGGADND